MAGWSTADIPDQQGRTAVVTGANSGIGLCTAEALAGGGAAVVLACRSEERGARAATWVRERVPGADVRVHRLDLADLASVREFAAWYPYDRLDLLINNAGVMALPFGRTVDGFERQFGVNHLGHFALTGLLLPRLLTTPGARVVSVSSFMHRLAGVDLDDLQSEHPYRRWIAYARSKTANLLFVHALARRLAAVGSDVVAAAAHPGYSDTNLQGAGPRMAGARVTEGVMSLGNRLFAQPAAAGALPTLYAATAPGVRPDSFTGPRIAGWRGAPAPARRAARAGDDETAERLWTASATLTGVAYEGLPSL
ncbi:oxidoreductase [Streptomyces sp. NPDC059256]|uniref:oxidoreductase n=1 Tax=Streptomyces sp. NPDC059256 TaxID=3346794 RepID=UPI003677ABD3